MGHNRYLAIFAILTFFIAGTAVFMNADTITTKDGQEIKGIVVEDYKDRIVFSTVDGETTVMKSDIRELVYDTEEDNLVKLAEQAAERRDYGRAMHYYEMALKANPDSASAKAGMAYLRGSVFRKEESAKAAAIRRQEDIELYGSGIARRTEADDVKDMEKALEQSTGMKISIKGAIPIIDNVKMNSPAYEAGIKRNDALISVWDKLTGYLSFKETLDLLVNKSAVEIRCVIERVIEVPINPGAHILSGTEDLIGASFAMELSGLTISGVKDDGAAARAGLEKEDLVTAIDGAETRYMPLKTAVELIKKSKAEAVKLTIRRKAIIWRTREI